MTSRHSTEFGSFEANYLTGVENRLKVSATEMWSKESSLQQYIIYADILRGS